MYITNEYSNWIEIRPATLRNEKFPTSTIIWFPELCPEGTDSPNNCKHPVAISITSFLETYPNYNGICFYVNDAEKERKLMELYFVKMLEIVRQDLLNNFNSDKYLFLSRDCSPFKKYVIERYNLDLSWDKGFKLSEYQYQDFTHLYNKEFILEGIVSIKDFDTENIVEVEYFELLSIYANVNIDTRKFKYDIYNEEKRIISEYNNKISHLFNKYDIIAFDDPKVKLDGKSLYEFFSDITRKKRSTMFAKKFEDFSTLDDIVRITQDIRFLIGQLLLYRPYISNYLNGQRTINNEIIYTYFPTIFDKRYFMSAGLATALFYNYWDKIGDLIDNCFGVIKKGNVYFGSVIDNVPIQYRNSQNYIWLKSFKDNEFNDLIKMRNEIVHYKDLETKFFDNYQSWLKDGKKMQDLQDEKNGIVDYLTTHNSKLLLGFERAAKLIDEIL